MNYETDIVMDPRKGKPGHPHTEEFKQHMSERTGSKNPFFGRKHSEASKEKMSLKRRGRKLSRDHCEAISNGLKGHNTPDWVRERISEGVLGYYTKHGMLKVSDYPPEFNAILKRRIMKRDHFRCWNPGCKNGRRLGVHHINYDKQDCRDENLITLCTSCNTRANYVSRHLWMQFYQFIVEERIRYERLAA